jgi:proteasome lid subunit RPN8/RPN11
MIVISPTIIADTLAELTRHGKGRKEVVVLWLAQKVGGQAIVQRVYMPLQESGRAFFHIPPQGMQRLFDELRPSRLMVAAQVHTHPQEAFHSPADDNWAVLRHVGALSLVLPYFAQRTTADNFIEQIKVYALTEADEWDEIQFKRDITIR